MHLPITNPCPSSIHLFRDGWLNEWTKTIYDDDDDDDRRFLYTEILLLTITSQFGQNKMKHNGIE
ncbi:hypothetical protein DERP_008112 [Dermatophagoides pteronyssinus]|uniref:Uncharacterized protein n=1 Tax=Dermatophagoides pteronyssinus TaxID=6956 RepID=A0ABQ8JJV8_DERPT|nr:hypothetical protein DERP_008112 [Dermatophagoides pteronyssinus]